MDEVEDQSSESTDTRWWKYKQSCREQKLEPMSWGAWLNAGQPLPMDK